MALKNMRYAILYLCFFLLGLGGTSLLLRSAEIRAQQLRPKDYAEMETKQQTEELKKESQKYLFIGDSRFNQMHNTIYAEDNVTWIAMDGATVDYYWENQSAISAIDKSAIVVYEIGVNDLDAQAETDVLKDLVSMGFSRVYFHAGMPADEDMEGFSLYYRTNDSINRFNTEMLSLLPDGVRYIPPFDIPIDTTDGVHYTDECYAEWYDALMTYLKDDL